MNRKLETIAQAVGKLKALRDLSIERFQSDYLLNRVIECALNVDH